MKKYVYLILFFVGVLGCNEREIEVYKAENYISFTNVQQDTMEVSFFLLGNLSEYACPIEIRYTGIPQEVEQEFSVVVLKDETTMKEGYYQLPEKPMFQPMSMLDTFYVNLINYEDLATEKVLLCLELRENAMFKLGDRDYRRIYLQVNDNAAKPEWWDDRVDEYFLGIYSDKKFRLLMQVVQPDLTNVSESWIRAWALEFKDYLDANPTEDEDGSLMTVPVRI